MNRLAFASLLLVVVSSLALAKEPVAGQWDCRMVSEYGDFEFKLALNEDSTYKKTTDFYGSVSIDTGQWTVEDTELVMNRTKTSKNGEVKDSDFQFRRTITAVSDATLELKHDDVITTCTRL